VDETIIKPLTPELLPDYLRFFDQDAFADNPDWASCYCCFYHFQAQPGEKDWEYRSLPENRQLAGELVRMGRLQGYLAYQGETPVAWCQAAPRRLILNIQNNIEWRVDEEERIGAIACFIVARPYRRQRIASQLLEAACDGFRRQGLVFAEAYPRTDTRSDAANYHGPLDMYLAAGFELVRKLETIAVVRKRLA
jgi:ribosomal protein S18 acetylase RimI-like enzyme